MSTLAQLGTSGSFSSRLRSTAGIYRLWQLGTSGSFGTGHDHSTRISGRNLGAFGVGAPHHSGPLLPSASTAVPLASSSVCVSLDRVSGIVVNFATDHISNGRLLRRRPFSVLSLALDFACSVTCSHHDTTTTIMGNNYDDGRYIILPRRIRCPRPFLIEGSNTNIFSN